MAAVDSADCTSFRFIVRFNNASVSSLLGANSNLRFYQFGHPRKLPVDASATACPLPAEATMNGSDDASAHAAVVALALTSGQAWLNDF